MPSPTIFTLLGCARLYLGASVRNLNRPPILSRLPTYALLACAKLRFAISGSLGKRAPHTCSVKVFGINRSGGLLPPRFLNTARIDSIESKLVDQPHHHCFRRAIVARNW